MIVFVNGTFDIIHPGHLKLLKYAKTLSNNTTVIVAIDSDDRVRKLKGPTRPVNPENNRLQMLYALKYVDLAYIFGTDEFLEASIAMLEPDVMVKGADYRDKPIIGAKHCGRIDFVELTNDSTTKIIQSISNR